MIKIFLLFIVAGTFSCVSRNNNSVAPKEKDNKGNREIPITQTREIIGRDNPTYEYFTAQLKSSYIQHNIEETKYTEQNLPRLGRNILLLGYDYYQKIMKVDHVKKAFTNEGDFFEAGRQKVFHNKGVTVFFKFVPASTKDHSYTGIFDTGAPYGIARFSLAVAPADKEIVVDGNKKKVKNYLPGVAVKFFIDEKPSLNIMAMFGLDGQESFNVFENSFSNIVEPIPQDPYLKDAVPVFTKALREIGDVHGQPHRLTVDHLAKQHADGSTLETYKAPFRITFEPTEDAKRFMPTVHPDFRVSLIRVPDSQVIGKTIYKVYGSDAQDEEHDEKNQTPGAHPKYLDGAKPKYLGEIVATSAFFASQFGDEGLFFKHFASPEAYAPH